MSKITRLIGRDQELQRLLALWDRAKRGEGQVALICGDGGIGKSHLGEFLSKYPPAEPGALVCGRSKRLLGAADAAPDVWAT